VHANGVGTAPRTGVNTLYYDKSGKAALRSPLAVLRGKTALHRHDRGYAHTIIANNEASKTPEAHKKYEVDKMPHLGYYRVMRWLGKQHKHPFLRREREDRHDAKFFESAGTFGGGR